MLDDGADDRRDHLVCLVLVFGTVEPVLDEGRSGRDGTKLSMPEQVVKQECCSVIALHTPGRQDAPELLDHRLVGRIDDESAVFDQDAHGSSPKNIAAAGAERFMVFYYVFNILSIRADISAQEAEPAYDGEHSNYADEYPYVSRVDTLCHNLWIVVVMEQRKFVEIF